VLDTIPGVGPTIRTSLLKTLGSARRVRESSVAELAAVPKITPKLTQRIFDHFHPPTHFHSPAETEPEPSTDGYNDRSQPGSKGGDST
jgi:ERCC4-type nuclease